MLRVVSRGDLGGSGAIQSGHTGRGGRLGSAIDLDREQLPPRCKTTLGRGNGHNDSLRRQPAGELLPQELSLLKVVAHAVIEIEATLAILVEAGGRIDAQGERPLGLFIRALHQWLL